MKDRYVLVHYIPKMDYFTLAVTNQSSYHYDSPTAARKACRELQPQMKRKLGYQKVKIIQTQCYDHGDCVSTVFDTEYVKQHELKD